MAEGRVVAFSVLRLCVDSCEAENIGGAVYSALLPESIYFSDLGELLTRLDSAMDAGYFPQAFMRLRSFQKVAVRYEKKDRQKMWKGEEREGTIATFDICIKTRKQADWQGSVSCTDGEVWAFNGVLELLRIIGANVKRKSDTLAISK